MGNSHAESASVASIRLVAFLLKAAMTTLRKFN